MQVKNETLFRHRIETKRIVVNVSWDTSETGDEIPRLIGEWSDWEDAIAVTPLSDDGRRAIDNSDSLVRRGRAVLALEDGVYAYKLKTSGGYFLNRAESRTVTRDHVTNNVLSVNGAREPLLHASAAPYVHFPAQGGVILRASTRKGLTRTLRVAWTEGSLPRETSMTACPLDDAPTASASHDHYEVHLPVSTPAVRYGFLLDDGALVAQDDGASFSLLGNAEDQVPAWWNDAVVYTVFVDRFRRGDDDGDWGTDPGAGQWAGGDLLGVRRSLG